MSFDFELNRGDLVLGPSGDFSTVVDTNLLAQLVLKILNTPVGDDPFNPTLGSFLTASQIGTIPDQDIIAGHAESAIEQSLLAIQSAQAAQQAEQRVTDAEKIVDFRDVIVQQDVTDPRQFNIFVDVISADLTPITLNFEFFAG